MSEQTQVQVPAEVSNQLELLEGFRDLVGERYGYLWGSRAKTKKMNKATADEREAVKTAKKAASDIADAISEAIPQWIEDADIEEYAAQQTALQTAEKAVGDADEVRKEAQKPYRKEIKPLTKAVKYMDETAIPDALKELGHPVQPRFSLSNYVKEALEAQ